MMVDRGVYYQSFTLIELLTVIAIISLLSTVVVGPVGAARKKARDAKKIAEIKVLQESLSQYAEDHGGLYPTALIDLVPVYLNRLPSNAVTLGKDRYIYTAYLNASPSASDYIGAISYHLGVKLDYNSSVLQSDRDCYGTTCSPAPYVAYETLDEGGAPVVDVDGSGNPPVVTAGASPNGPNPTSDFGGLGANENLNNICRTNKGDCIFDVTPEQ